MQSISPSRAIRNGSQSICIWGGIAKLHRLRYQQLLAQWIPTGEGRRCGMARKPAPPGFRFEHAWQLPDLKAVMLARACAAAAFDSASAAQPILQQGHGTKVQVTAVYCLQADP